MMDDINLRDSAEYRALTRLTPDLQLAVKAQLTSLGAQLVAVDLITPGNYSCLINPMLPWPEDYRAAYLVQLIQQKVQQDSRWYQTFIDVLEKDHSLYSGIVGSIQRTVNLLHQQKQSNIVDATPSSIASASSLYFPSHCGREQY